MCLLFAAFAYVSGSNVRDAAAVMTGPAASNYTADGVTKGLSAVAGIPDPPAATSRRDSVVGYGDGNANVFVAGSLAVDLACDFAPRTGSTLSSPELQTSNPAQIAQSLGGVS